MLSKPFPISSEEDVIPTYTFVKRSTGETVCTDFMSISEMEKKLSDDPDLDVAPPTQSTIVDPWRMGRKKPDDGFREVLGRMKRFYKGNNITE